MELLAVLLIVAFLNGALLIIDEFLNNLVNIALYAENMMASLMGHNGFTEIFSIFFSFGISLIVLKFLKKGFDVYILWTEGDADADPLLLLTNFFKALAVAISFPTLYGWLAYIVEDIINRVLAAINSGMNQTFATFFTGLTSAGIFPAIVALIFTLCLLYLFLKFINVGLEILTLRIGLPLACVGFLDGDKGVFRTYIQKFFQSAFTVIIQIVFVRLGVALLLNVHPFWGLGALLMAIRSPRFLQEFLILPASGGGGMSTVYQTSRMAQMFRSAIK